ncbi:MAG: iron permease [Alphaproteobacteria bacterium]|nr:MAG: iron permease [Alphaproteobacteria bacterium]
MKISFQYVLGCVVAALTLLASDLLEAEEAALPAAGSAQVVWQILDYMAVDYAAAVDGGVVINAGEYEEMEEFAATARARIAELPETAARAALVEQAEALVAAVERKARPDEVATLARGLARALLEAYPVVMAPSSPPDLARARVLYAENCATCHGATGDADGPAAEGMDPPPIAFTDLERARERSVFGLYQAISQGLEGTAMASYQWMSQDDRWALAFYVGSMAFTGRDVEAGKQLWETRPDIRQTFASLEDVTSFAPASRGLALDDGEAVALTAFLRRHPEIVLPSPGGQLDRTRHILGEAARQYSRGDVRAARDLALSAYLDGFEPVEPQLSARDPHLMRQIESAMLELRGLISDRAPVPRVEAQIDRIRALLDQAEQTLASGEGGVWAGLVGAFTVLLREGLEALLIVVAMIAFLRKSKRADVLPYVHGGWIAALAAGGLTWAAATWLISIGGVGRELTEGIGALLAAVVLVSVGIWMHGKAQAGAWQQYIADRMSKALTRRSAWLLFLLAFVVVYREVFETILFFVALWSQGNGGAILAGAAGAIAALGLCAWALLVYSRRLPIEQFFRYSAILIAVLAVVLAGKGVAALQEAGWLAAAPLTWLPRVEIAGLFPTAQGLVVQCAVAIVLVLAFWYNGRMSARARASKALAENERQH